MTGFLERQCEHVSYLRVGELPRWDWGFGVLHEGTVAHVFGLHGTMTIDFWRAAAEVLMDAGFTHVEFTRLNEAGEFEPHRRLLRRRGHTVRGSCVADAEIEPPQRQPMDEKRLHILGGDIVVVGVEGKLRNHFPGPNNFRVKEGEYVNIVQPEYITFLESLLKLDELPKPAADEGRVHVLQSDTFVVDAEGYLHTHIKGAKYLNLADSVFLAIEGALIASQKRLNEAARAGFAAAQAATPAAA